MLIDRITLAYARQAVREAVRDFLFTPNVGLIDFGHPLHDGQVANDELAIRIHVDQKLTGITLEAAIDTEMTKPIPPFIDGFPTDIPEGVYQLHQGWNGWLNSPSSVRAIHTDPLSGGMSISDEFHYTFGTLGGKVIDRATGEEMLLSNWHVLVGDWLARSNRQIYQPGQLDGGTPADTVATLTRDVMAINLDAAVATINGSRHLINNQIELGPVQGVTPATIGMKVVKSGRKTGVTYGIVTAVEGFAKLNYTGMDRVIRNVITIDPPETLAAVSDGGDSGSWWLDSATMKVIGLHFAGSNMPERGLAIDMQSVLNALNVDIATAA